MRIIEKHTRREAVKMHTSVRRIAGRICFGYHRYLE